MMTQPSAISALSSTTDKSAKYQFAQNPRWAHNIGLTAGEFHIYSTGRTFSDADGTGAFPDHQTIAKEAGVSPRSVESAMQKFDLMGLIATSARHRANGSQTSNSYKFHNTCPEHLAILKLAVDRLPVKDPKKEIVERATALRDVIDILVQGVRIVRRETSGTPAQVQAAVAEAIGRLITWVSSQAAPVVNEQPEPAAIPTKNDCVPQRRGVRRTAEGGTPHSGPLTRPCTRPTTNPPPSPPEPAAAVVADAIGKEGESTDDLKINASAAEIFQAALEVSPWRKRQPQWSVVKIAEAMRLGLLDKLYSSVDAVAAMMAHAVRDVDTMYPTRILNARYALENKVPIPQQPKGPRCSKDGHGAQPEQGCNPCAVDARLAQIEQAAQLLAAEDAESQDCREILRRKNEEYERKQAAKAARKAEEDRAYREFAAERARQQSLCGDLMAVA